MPTPMTKDNTMPRADDLAEHVHWISANRDRSANVTACGRPFVYPMRGNGWRVRDITCPECDRAICDLVHDALRSRSTGGDGDE